MASIQRILEEYGLKEVNERQRLGHGVEIEPLKTDEMNGIRVTAEHYEGIVGTDETSWVRITLPEDGEPLFEKAYEISALDKPQWKTVGVMDPRLRKDYDAYNQGLIADDILISLKRIYEPEPAKPIPSRIRKVAARLIDRG